MNKPAFFGPLSESERARSRFKFAEYDVETVSKDDPTFRLIGFYHDDTYLCFRDMKKFLEYVIQPEFDGYRFFAHYGGKFDIGYVWEAVRKHYPDLSFSFYCSGGAVIAFSLKSGGCEWRFTDSYRLMDRSLKTLTREFNVTHKKTPLAPDDWRYNRNDCLGLHEVLTAFFDEFNVCSETVASHALRVFRTFHLDREIKAISPGIEAYVRKAYYGGRCEVYRYDEADLHKYDVNSLYPTAMLGPVPVEYIGMSKKVPDDDCEIGFYHAEIDYPETYVPALAYRVGKLFFPIGKMSGYWTSMEIRQAVADGAAVKIRSGILFRAEPIFAGYVMDLHTKKQKAEEEHNQGRRYIYKKLLNSLYGKFGQRRIRRAYALDPGTSRMLNVPGYPKVYPLVHNPQVVWYWTQSLSRHILPHIAAAVTARARMIQLAYLRMPGRIWYTDTDSLFTDDWIGRGTELGEMKYEGSGLFRAWNLKEYSFAGEISLKGVPLTKLDEASGEKIRDESIARRYLEGWELQLQRNIGFMEAIRAGESPCQKIWATRARRTPVPKRCRIGNDTRPWTVRELEKGPKK